MSRNALSLLTIAVVSVCLGQLHLAGAVDHPEIVFNDLYHVVFVGNSLSRFHRCLCNESMKSCTAEYSLTLEPGAYIYEVDDIDDEDIDDEEDDSNGDNYGTSYQCRPGQFNARGEITCTRLKQNDKGCLSLSLTSFLGGANVCSEFGVPTTQRRCDLSCVDILWSGYSVTYGYFPRDEQPKPGSCAGPTPTTQTTTPAGQIPPETTTTGKTPSSSQGADGGAVSMKNDEEGGGDNSLALGVGLGCAFIGVIVTVFAAVVIFWRRKRKRDASLNKPTLPYIPHLHANNTYSSASGAGSEKRKFSTGENGTEYATYLEPVHVYSQVTDEEAQAAVYENIGDVERGRSTRKGGAAAATSNGGRVAVTPIIESSASGSSTSNTHNSKSDPYDMANDFESSTSDQGKKKKKKNGKKENDGRKRGGGDIADLSHDYNRLHTGRSGKGEEVSRSILARYNNPPTPPTPHESPDDDEDSIYEGYDEDWKGEEKQQEEEEKEKAQAKEASMNAYSMAAPIDGVEVGQVTPSANGRHLGETKLPSPYVNLQATAAQGVSNAAFTPDKSDTSGHEYFSLEENAKNIGEGGEGREQINSSKSKNPEGDRPVSVYFELEKETKS